MIRRGNRIHERCLARAVRAYNRYDFPRLYRHVEVVERQGRFRKRPSDLIFKHDSAFSVDFPKLAR